MGLFSKIFKKIKNKNEKYKLGLHKSRESLGNLKKLLDEKKTIDEDLFDELEEILIMADIGLDTVLAFMEDLRKEINVKHIKDPKELQEIIVDEMFNLYLQDEVVIADLQYTPNEVNVYLFVGVNGVGKTTSIGKLAYQLKKEGKKVLMVAADTFRAGAIEQLSVWGERAGVEI